MAQQGHAGFDAAMMRYQRPLTLYALRITRDPERARDVVQETFAKLCSEPPADVNGHLAEWLYTVCRNKALDVRRKERRMTLVDEHVESPSLDIGPAERVEQQDTSAMILKTIARLPEHEQEVIRLKFQHGLSYQQIAKVTGLSVSNVGFLMHTGLKKVRAKFTVPSPGNPGEG